MYYIPIPPLLYHRHLLLQFFFIFGNSILSSIAEETMKEKREHMRFCYYLSGSSYAALAVSFLLVFLFFRVLLSYGYFIPSSLSGIIQKTPPPLVKTKQHIPILPFTCPLQPTNVSSCSLSKPAFIINYPSHNDPSSLSTPVCPDYFRWIHNDLLPWKDTGITKETLLRANKTAHFRLVVINGRAYVEKYKRSFQTRDVFTIWGILQLLRRYPGRVPDVDLMFDCNDWPVVKVDGSVPPPPLFGYCGDNDTLDIAFPDWSFWGWPEINIKPWNKLSMEIKEGNSRVKWIDREPYAYWKGNPMVATTRMDLMKCNVSDNQDWNARLFAQDWRSESRDGFKKSNLGRQCYYRYKIYIEGTAWSVSEKYILLCDSMALVVTPRYYDFFTRSLMPVEHYWPVDTMDKCRSIEFAVRWGNRHKRKAEEIGKKASEFIFRSLMMDNVYDYMFHLLNEYSKLLKLKPTIPPHAIEFCAESMVCHFGREEGLVNKFMLESMLNFSKLSSPCKLPPPFSPGELSSLVGTKKKSIQRVEIWRQKSKRMNSNHILSKSTIFNKNNNNQSEEYETND